MRPLAFVLAVWAVMAAAAVAYVATFGRDVPYMDDWVLVDGICGGEMPRAQWLWHQHNEHRMPVPRLIFLGLAVLTGFDSRSGMVASVAVFGALAATFVWAVRRVRGHTVYADAFFPVALLNLEHGWNFLMNTQLFFICATSLACVWLLFIYGKGWERRRWIVVMGIALVLMPLHGANGLILTPFAAAFLFIAAVVRWREGAARAKSVCEKSGSPPGSADVPFRDGARTRETSDAPLADGDVRAPREAAVRAFRTRSKTDAWLLGAFAIAGFVLSGLYLIGYHRPSHHPISPSTWASVKVSARFLSLGFGPLAEKTWPFSFFLTAILYGAAIAVAWRTYRRQPKERLRALGFVLFFAGMLALAGAVGVGRGAFGETAGFDIRYVSMTVLLMCWVYLAWDRFGGPRASRWAGIVLFAFALLTLPYNTRVGLTEGRTRKAILEAFERDLKAGMTPQELAERHYRTILPLKDYFVKQMTKLRDARLGPYRGRAPGKSE